MLLTRALIWEEAWGQRKERDLKTGCASASSTVKAADNGWSGEGLRQSGCGVPSVSPCGGHNKPRDARATQSPGFSPSCERPWDGTPHWTGLIEWEWESTGALEGLSHFPRA